MPTAETAIASRPGDEPITSIFFRRVAEKAGETAIIARRGDALRPHTWGELGDDVRRFAAGLVRDGVSAGDRVVVISPNRYEWIVADLGTQLARAVHVPIHAALSGPQIAWQIADAGAQLVFLSGLEQAEKLAGSVDALRGRVRWVSFDSCVSLSLPMSVETLTEFTADISPAQLARVTDNLPAIKPSDLCTILYTSGTTGEPKGVMLSHGNLAFNAVSSLDAFGPQAGDRRLSWLPLSHIFARTCDAFTWIAQGCEMVLADAPETVVPQCKEYHPTLMNGVPYFFEKVQRYVTTQQEQGNNITLAEVFGGRLRAGIAGGAPLPLHVGEYYRAQGVRLLEGYGLTETSPVISTCTHLAHKLGTVGPPIPGVEVKIADDGEILTRGPHVMQGYWRKPEATAEIVRGGWLHTGDLGKIDAEGYLKITGRKKDLIVTSGGKNIAPTYLEGLLSADPFIRQVVVIGDRRNFLSALIVPEPDQLRPWVFARELQVTSVAEALAHPEVRQLFRQNIDERLKGVSRYEQIGDFVLLDRGLTVENGELTPTLKLRRGVIAEHFAEQIEAMYQRTRVHCSP
ncbi:MAG: long-chain fatty acid--CoA ligase [Planctomycetes bacterium]|nr:long-chain fatty acid--CoA ligase [Planctomycetota bacterium]